jgi:hypothetical protein
MSKPKYDLGLKIRQRCEVLGRECQIEVLFSMAEFSPPGLFSVSLYHTTSEMSLRSLEKLAGFLGTRNINLSCDMSTESDHPHDKVIVVRWPSVDDAAVVLGNAIKEEQP